MIELFNNIANILQNRLVMLIEIEKPTLFVSRFVINGFRN